MQFGTCYVKNIAFHAKKWPFEQKVFKKDIIIFIFY